MFVLWVTPDDYFIGLQYMKATEFFKVGTLPEFLGNWYSKVPTLKSHNPSTSDNHNKLASSAF